MSIASTRLSLQELVRRQTEEENNLLRRHAITITEPETERKSKIRNRRSRKALITHEQGATRRTKGEEENKSSDGESTAISRTPEREKSDIRRTHPIEMFEEEEDRPTPVRRKSFLEAIGAVQPPLSSYPTTLTKKQNSKRRVSIFRNNTPRARPPPRRSSAASDVSTIASSFAAARGEIETESTRRQDSIVAKPVKIGPTVVVSGVDTSEAGIREKIAAFIHSKPAQVFITLLLVLDVVLVIVELVLQAHTECHLFIEKGSCVPPPAGAFPLVTETIVNESGFYAPTGCGVFGETEIPHGIHVAEVYIVWFSRGILIFFMVEILVLIACLGRHFFTFLYTLDLIIVATSLILSFLFDHNPKVESETALIVFLRCWRFARILHGFGVTVHHVDHPEEDDEEGECDCDSGAQKRETCGRRRGGTCNRRHDAAHDDDEEVEVIYDVEEIDAGRKDDDDDSTVEGCRGGVESPSSASKNGVHEVTDDAGGLQSAEQQRKGGGGNPFTTGCAFAYARAEEGSPSMMRGNVDSPLQPPTNEESATNSRRRGTHSLVNEDSNGGVETHISSTLFPLTQPNLAATATDATTAANDNYPQPHTSERCCYYDCSSSLPPIVPSSAKTNSGTLINEKYCHHEDHDAQQMTEQDVTGQLDVVAFSAGVSSPPFGLDDDEAYGADQRENNNDAGTNTTTRSKEGDGGTSNCHSTAAPAGVAVSSERLFSIVSPSSDSASSSFPSSCRVAGSSKNVIRKQKERVRVGGSPRLTAGASSRSSSSSSSVSSNNTAAHVETKMSQLKNLAKLRRRQKDELIEYCQALESEVRRLSHK